MRKLLFILAFLPFVSFAQYDDGIQPFPDLGMSKIQVIDSVHFDFMVIDGVDSVCVKFVNGRMVAVNCQEGGSNVSDSLITGADYDTTTNTLTLFRDAGNINVFIPTGSGGGGTAAWGSIGGDISEQTDLISLLSDYVLESDTGTMLDPYLRKTVANDSFAEIRADIPTNNNQLTNGAGYIGSANLGITGSTGARTITSDVGTDATIPVATPSVSGVMAPADKSKLDGIATGAEVNVNPDWNAVSGDAQILNKPYIVDTIDIQAWIGDAELISASYDTLTDNLTLTKGDGSTIVVQIPQSSGGGGSTSWGAIGGTITDQADLIALLNTKANDADVVHKSGAETIGGEKTFTNILKLNGSGVNQSRIEALIGSTRIALLGDVSNDDDGSLFLYDSAGVEGVRLRGRITQPSWIGGSLAVGKITNPATKLDVNGVITATGGNSTQWNTAYGYGPHTGLYVSNSLVGANNGVASLDAGGKIPVTQLPASLMIYKGVWNASTNSPTLSNGTGTTGWVYKASPGGTVNFGAGNITFSDGDWAIYNGSTWEKSSNTDQVVSVNGEQGVVSLNTDEVPEGASNEYFTIARARASVSATGSLSYNSSTGEFSYSPTFGTISGTIAEGNDSRIINGQTAFGWGDFRDYGLDEAVFFNGDLNTITDTRFMLVDDAATNTPVPGVDFYVLSFGNLPESEFMQQLAFQRGGNNTYIRQKNTTTWGAWVKIALDSDLINSASYNDISDILTLTKKGGGTVTVTIPTDTIGYTKAETDSALISQDWVETTNNMNLTNAHAGMLLKNSDLTNDTIIVPDGLTIDSISQIVAFETHSTGSIVLSFSGTNLSDFNDDQFSIVEIKAGAIRRYNGDRWRLLGQVNTVLTAIDGSQWNLIVNPDGSLDTKPR